jgi:hypothetical protein
MTDKKKKVVPFAPQFSYTPRWKGNNKRTPEEQFTVTLRDLPERQRIERYHEAIALDVSGVSAEDSANPQAAMEKAVKLSKERLELRERLVEKHLIAVENLSVVAPNGEEVIEIRTFAELKEHAYDVVMEIFNRLLSGPDEEEIKNS